MTIYAHWGWKNNADMIARGVRPLGYLDGTVLDATYGLGNFWTDWRPEHLTAVDLHPDKGAVTADFRHLPFPDGGFDSVVFDPGYKLCLDDQTEVLTRRGWLSCDDVKVGDAAYSLNVDSGLAEWRPITALHVYDREPTEVVACEGKNLDFVATLGHKWPVASPTGQRHWVTSSTFRSTDRVQMAARWANVPEVPTYSDAFVELVAWFWTEGHIDKPGTYVDITQSHRVNAGHCARIRRCLESCYGPAVDGFRRNGRTAAAVAWRVRRGERNDTFILSASAGAQLVAVAPDRVPSLSFLESLTERQLDLFVETSMDGDGTRTRGGHRLTQKRQDQADAFAVACILAGRPLTQIHRDNGNGHVVTLKNRQFSKPTRAPLTQEVRNVRVWCPTVEGNHTWLARRNGRIYFTGNSGTPGQGGPASSDANYGITEALSWQERYQLMFDGMTECARVSRRYVLVKCMDQVSSGHVRWQTVDLTIHGARVGLDRVDHFDLPGYREQPKDRTRRCSDCDGTGARFLDGTGTCLDCDGAGFVPVAQQHAARNWSTLLVFRKLRPGRHTYHHAFPELRLLPDGDD